MSDAAQPPAPEGGTDDEALNHVLRARREKLAALDAYGIPPYAYRYDRTHTSSEAIAAYTALEAEARAIAASGPVDEPMTEVEAPVVRVSGRLLSWRSQGKTAFAHLGDAAGRVQLYLRRDQLGDAFDVVKSAVDVGDVVGVSGPCFRTRAGEVSVRVETFELLAKSLRPLPFGKEAVVDGQLERFDPH